MKNRYVPVNILPETRELVRAIREKTGVPHYRIVHDAVVLWGRVSSKKKISFKLVEEK